jgi:polyisoprenoid-binding protein YceI
MAIDTVAIDTVAPVTSGTSAPQRTGAAVSTWQLDPAHTQIEFAVRHLMIPVRGRFTAFSGALQLDEADPARSTAEVVIEAASVDTRQEQRDAHLRSADFFDTERFPTLTFRSRRVEPLGGQRYRVVGDLTIRDVTREVALDVTYEGRMTDPWGAERVGVSAHGALNRHDFGLGWNAALEAGGFLVGDEVKLDIAAQAVHQRDARVTA